MIYGIYDQFVMHIRASLIITWAPDTWISLSHFSSFFVLPHLPADHRHNQHFMAPVNTVHPLISYLMFQSERRDSRF